MSNKLNNLKETLALINSVLKEFKILIATSIGIVVLIIGFINRESIITGPTSPGTTSPGTTITPPGTTSPGTTTTPPPLTPPPLTPPPLTPFNAPIIYLVDNSGSMGECSSKDEQGKCIKTTEKEYKISEVKNTLIKQIDPQLSGSDLIDKKIGLVEFGNWEEYGSPSIANQKDDEKSIFQCRAIQTRVELGLDNRDQLKEQIERIKPNDAGVTPIGYAINYVVNNVLKGQTDNPAQIILITDGEPNCKNENQLNLCSIIRGLNNDTEIKVHVDLIGYKIKGGENEFKECARDYPEILEYHGDKTNEEELLNTLDYASSYKFLYVLD